MGQAVNSFSGRRGIFDDLFSSRLEGAGWDRIQIAGRGNDENKTDRHRVNCSQGDQRTNIGCDQVVQGDIADRGNTGKGIPGSDLVGLAEGDLKLAAYGKYDLVGTGVAVGI